MNRNFVIGSALVSVLLISGCSGATWNVRAACKQDGGCEIEGTIGGTIKSGPQALLANRLLLASEIIDAAEFELSIAGSTISYPTSGQVTLSLIDRSDNSVQAARQFGWVRTGTVIRLADPNAVNAWAASEGGTANDINYKMARFNTGARPGDHVASVQTSYAGAVTASATTHFTVCAPHPTPHLCMN